MQCLCLFLSMKCLRTGQVEITQLIGWIVQIRLGSSAPESLLHFHRHLSTSVLNCPSQISVLSTLLDPSWQQVNMDMCFLKFILCIRHCCIPYIQILFDLCLFLHKLILSWKYGKSKKHFIYLNFQTSHLSLTYL